MQTDRPRVDSVVLHADIDSFFVQVEMLRHPHLRGKPVAIEQHMEVIAANAPARQAGVKKHMPPAQARQLLQAVNGIVHHVFCEDDGRASYRPYREASAAFIRLLKRFPMASVVEKASIDEAYIMCHQTRQVPGGGAAPLDMSWGVELGTAIRSAAESELGLTVSVGVAVNKLLAKLASRAAKPDGLKVISSAAEVEGLLNNMSIEQLPGMGGMVSVALARGGLTLVREVQPLGDARLVREFGLRPAVAATLAAWCHGRDDTPVQDRGPPLSLSVQMSINAVQFYLGHGGPAVPPQHHGAPQEAPAGAAGGATTAARNKAPGPAPGPPPALPVAPPATVGNDNPEVPRFAAPGSAESKTMMQPLLVGSPTARPRLGNVLPRMCADLLGRVMLDRHQENRWPSKLGLMMVTKGVKGRADGKTVSRTTAFPPPYLINADGERQPPATVGDAGVGAAARRGDGNGAGSLARGAAVAVPDVSLMVAEKTHAASAALLAATTQRMDNLMQLVLSLSANGTMVTKLAVSATGFGPFQAAAAAGTATSGHASLHSYFTLRGTAATAAATTTATTAATTGAPTAATTGTITAATTTAPASATTAGLRPRETGVGAAAGGAPVGSGKGDGAAKKAHQGAREGADAAIAAASSHAMLPPPPPPPLRQLMGSSSAVHAVDAAGVGRGGVARSEVAAHDGGLLGAERGAKRPRQVWQDEQDAPGAEGGSLCAPSCRDSEQRDVRVARTSDRPGDDDDGGSGVHTAGLLAHTAGPPAHSVGPPAHTVGPPAHTVGPPARTAVTAGPLVHTAGPLAHRDQIAVVDEGTTARHQGALHARVLPPVPLPALLPGRGQASTALLPGRGQASTAPLSALRPPAVSGLLRGVPMCLTQLLAQLSSGLLEEDEVEGLTRRLTGRLQAVGLAPLLLSAE